MAKHSQSTEKSILDRGREHITPERIARLRRTLPADDRRALLSDLTLAPEWMHRTLKELAS